MVWLNIALTGAKIVTKGLKAWKKSRRIKDNIKKMRGEKKGFEKLSKKHQDEAYDVDFKNYVKKVEKKKKAKITKEIRSAGRSALYAITKDKIKKDIKQIKNLF